jgi:uncharacterized protein YggU (UPF0235/DUF167 family)
VGWQDGVLRVRVTAAPDGGEANRAVAVLLADALRVPRSRIALVRGAAARDKLFRVERVSLAEARVRIPVTLPPGGGGESR